MNHYLDIHWNILADVLFYVNTPIAKTKAAGDLYNYTHSLRVK